LHEPRCNNILHQLLDSSRCARRVVHCGIPRYHLFVFIQAQQEHAGRNNLASNYCANHMGCYIMVQYAAIRNYKLVQEALAEICHCDISWFCGNFAGRSFCVVRSSLVRLALRERMSTICASEQNA